MAAVGCEKHIVKIKDQSQGKNLTRLFVYGSLDLDYEYEDGSDDYYEIGSLMTLPQFEQCGQIDVRFPHLQYRSVASLNGKVYFIGGESCSTSEVFPTVEVVDCQTGKVTKAPPLKTPRHSAAVAVSANELFICCGNGETGIRRLSTCERWVEGSPSWLPLPPIEQARWAAGAIVLAEDDAILPNATHLLLTGGYDGSISLSNVSLLNVGAEGDAGWIDLAPMNHARGNHGIAIFAGRVLVVGGFECNSMEMLSPLREVGDPGQWTDLNPLSVPTLWGVSLAVYQNRLLAFEWLRSEKSQIEEFVTYTTGQNFDEEVDLKQFTWRRIAGCPDALKCIDVAVVVDISKERPK